MGGKHQSLCAADTQFGHGAHPKRQASLLTRFDDAKSFKEAADALQLDIHNTAGIQIGSTMDVIGCLDAFIEAERGADLTLHAGRGFNVFAFKWLLEHHQSNT